MANAEQLALLKAGVEGWNKWWEENHRQITFGQRLTVDLSKADLHRARARLVGNANRKASSA